MAGRLAATLKNSLKGRARAPVFWHRQAGIFNARIPVEVINTSINQTLARTVMTSVTTLLVLVSLFVFGGEVIHAFSLALIVGVLIGTYSSIFVASTTALALGVSKADLMPAASGGEGESGRTQP